MRAFPIYGWALPLAALALAPQAGAPTPWPQGVVKIATQSPLSGGQATLGEGVRRGAQLAIEQLAGALDKLGVKIELAPFDDQGRPDVAATNAGRIVAEGSILLVIGHLDGTALSALDVYREAQLAMISLAAAPAVTDLNYANASRISGRDDVQGVAGAEFARTLKIKTASIAHDGTTYGWRVAEAFRKHATKLGIEVIGFEGMQDRPGFDRIVAPLRARQPDLMYLAGNPDEAARFLREAREGGVRARFMGPDALASPDFVRMAGRVAVGTYYTTTAGPLSSYAGARQFARAYRQRFKNDPDTVAALAYDATATGLKALETAIKEIGGRGSPRGAVAAALRKVRHAGITGAIEFDEKGDLKKSLYFVFQVASDDPAKWGDNKEVMRLELPPPPLKKQD
ncbi:MAG: branched-chain amino acid ABC transporter substrate-binding protein [Candidatus Rokubacteria bacterium]|nr:branched-chain amino acid ABC transporter substrate-binding protein [Candidatus Rokubacteria bacterium]